MEIAFVTGDRERFHTYLDLTVAAGGSDRELPLAERAVWGDSATAEAAWDSLMRSNSGTSQIALGAAVTARPEAVGRALAAIERRLAEVPGATTLRFGDALVALSTGRLAKLETSVAAMEASESPNIRALAALLRIFTVLGGMRSSDFASPSLEFFKSTQSPAAAAFVEAMLALSDGDAPRARRLVETPLPDGAGSLPHLFRGVSGWAYLLEGDTARGIAELRSATDSLPDGELGGDQVRTSLRFQLARVLAMQPATHEEGIRMLRYGFPINRAPELLPASYLATAEALEAMGNYAEAIDAYSRLVQLLTDADAELQPRVTAANEAIEKLTREIG